MVIGERSASAKAPGMAFSTSGTMPTPSPSPRASAMIIISRRPMGCAIRMRMPDTAISANISVVVAPSTGRGIWVSRVAMKGDRPSSSRKPAT